ncbi:MAG: T9SS type A sorting domain-containing protein [bacterium]
MRKTLALVLMLAIGASFAFAAPTLQQKVGDPIILPMLDTFDDTIYYDDNQPWWWYGGQTNFNLATKFTPLADFEFQAFGLAFNSVGNVTITLNADDSPLNQPGTILGGPWVVNIPVANVWTPTIVDTLGAYLFEGGENFWINLNSAGPPWETFDISPVNPPRSFLKWSTSTTYAPSPGDHFIRAVGEYTSAIVDIACNSVTHNGNFFATNGSSFAIAANVSNESPSTPATVNVGCHIYTEVDDVTYVLFDSLNVQTVMLAPGASTTITWAADYTFNVDNRYRIDAIAYYGGDVNPDNNSQSTETQIYTAPPPNVELRYDDTQYDGAAYTSTVGDAWGMMFDPQAGGSYDIASISVAANAGTGDLAARIRLLNDNAGTPGTVLWETTQIMSLGWNDFTVGVSTTGPVYLMYVFENGASTSALYMDGYPKSGNAWDYDALTSTYTPAPGSEDWAMRITLGEGAPPPAFVVNLTYVSGSPVPAGGGNLNFDVYILNDSGQSQDYDAWLASEYEGGAPTTLVMRSFVNYQAGWAINRPGMFYPVPGGWAAGNYTLNARVGYEPGTVWNEDGFAWIKSGVSDGTPFQPYAVDGAPNPFDVIETNGMAVASEFALNGAYPNPFNPTTTINYSLANAEVVNLSVFDISGREVATLVNGYRNAGAHDVVFDASQLASGIYVTKLTAGSNVVTAKLVLLK